MSSININQFHAFYMAARYSSMALAAERLHVTTPAVSMQVKKLEEWLGFKLFIRKQNTLVLTAQGEELFSLCEHVFDAVNVLDEHVKSLMHVQEKELLFGAYHVPAQYFVPDMLALVAQQYPHILVRIIVGTQEESMERLLKNDIHIALIIGDAPSPLFECVPLFGQDLVLAVGAKSTLAPSGSISIADLNMMPIALQPSGTGFMTSMHRYFSQHNITPQMALDNLSSDIVKKMLPQRNCAAFFVRFAIEEELENGILREVHICEGAPRVQFNFAYLRKNRQSRRIQQFLQALENFCLPGSFSTVPR